MTAMADDFSTPTGVDAVLAATASYDIDRDVAMAKRRVTALRRKLDFATTSRRDGQSMEFDFAIIQSQLQQALDWIQANETLTDAQRLSNPSVLHADFSTFGPYARGDI